MRALAIQYRYTPSHVSNIIKRVTNKLEREGHLWNLRASHKNITLRERFDYSENSSPLPCCIVVGCIHIGCI
jgi:hypothetical protein